VKTLATLASYSTTPDWGEGGVWQSGCGLAGDGEGNIYAVCGNGDPLPKNLSGQALARQITGPFFGESVLKLRLDKGAKSFVLKDWFVTKDIVEENKDDVDFCAGPVLLPWGDLMGAMGKDRAYYILDRGNMGKFNPEANAIAQYAPDMTQAQNTFAQLSAEAAEILAFMHSRRSAHFRCFGRFSAIPLPPHGEPGPFSILPVLANSARSTN
jgi:hypothetical protein